MISSTDRSPPHHKTSSDMSPTIRRAMKEENAIEELRVMLNQEQTRYSITFDYLTAMNPDGSTPSSERVSEGWRRKICEWSFEVVDHFGFDREVVSIALDYLDRVVALKTEPYGEAMHRREFQLIAVTSLYLAIKVHGETDSLDGPRRKLKIHAFVELSRGLFSVETLEEKEREVLELLQWNVNPPSTVRIVATLLRLLPEWNVYDFQPAHATTATAIYEMARYLTELAVCVSTFAFNFKTSEIAYAAILCSIEALQHKIHIPYAVRIEFLNKITGAIRLTPQSVGQICVMLKELCPAMFARSEDNAGGLIRSESITSAEQNETVAESARESPVCVMAQCREEASPRKRGRHQAL